MSVYNREISTLQLNPGVLGKLLRNGCNTIGCLFTQDAFDLSKCIGTSCEEAEKAISLAQQAVAAVQGKTCLLDVKSAWTILSEEQERECIVTFCEGLDSMLGGGIALGTLTEICGAPGAGKTQFGMQLAVSVCIPERLGGVEGECVYIDTEGSLVVERLAEIAGATVAHCHRMEEAQGQAPCNENKSALSVETFLSGVHCFRCYDYHDLMALVQVLPEFLNQNRKVKLIVLDSLARPFRYELENMALRQRLLSSLAQSFLKVAAQFGVAVVLTNQMTTKILPRAGDSHLIPALGDSWAHVCPTRIVLSADKLEGREALLLKAPNRKMEKCHFQITNDGIRGVS